MTAPNGHRAQSTIFIGYRLQRHMPRRMWNDYVFTKYMIRGGPDLWPAAAPRCNYERPIRPIDPLADGGPNDAVTAAMRLIVNAIFL